MLLHQCATLMDALSTSKWVGPGSGVGLQPCALQTGGGTRAGGARQRREPRPCWNSGHTTTGGVGLGRRGHDKWVQRHSSAAAESAGLALCCSNEEAEYWATDIMLPTLLKAANWAGGEACAPCCCAMACPPAVLRLAAQAGALSCCHFRCSSGRHGSGACEEREVKGDCVPIARWQAAESRPGKRAWYTVPPSHAQHMACAGPRAGLVQQDMASSTDAGQIAIQFVMSEWEPHNKERGVVLLGGSGGGVAGGLPPAFHFSPRNRLRWESGARGHRPALERAGRCQDCAAQSEAALRTPRTPLARHALCAPCKTLPPPNQSPPSPPPPPLPPLPPVCEKITRMAQQKAGAFVSIPRARLAFADPLSTSGLGQLLHLLTLCRSGAVQSELPVLRSEQVHCVMLRCAALLLDWP